MSIINATNVVVRRNGPWFYKYWPIAKVNSGGIYYWIYLYPSVRDRTALFKAVSSEAFFSDF